MGKRVMGDAERDEAPTTPPKAIRPGEPMSGMRAESLESIEVEVDISKTDLSVTEPSARDPNTMMSLPKPEPGDEQAPIVGLRTIEDRLDALELRMRELEARRDPLSPTRGTPWWFWLLFLFGLAVTWRLLEALN
jgi:hypothetical protein